MIKSHAAVSLDELFEDLEDITDDPRYYKDIAASLRVIADRAEAQQFVLETHRRNRIATESD